MKPLDNGAVCWAIGLGLILVFDAHLIRGGRLSLSEHARAHPRATASGVAFFALHFAGVLGKWDPLSRAAGLLRGSVMR